MNCKHVQELLPLYVGRDLEEKRARMVTAHVQSCAECAGSLDEYRETRQLLQKFAPPQFGEAVYAGIRQRVLREIAQEPNPRSLPQLVAILFRPRISWAVATALLLAVSLFAFYFMAGRRSEPRQVSREIDRTKQGDPGKESPGHDPGVVASRSSKNSEGRNTDKETTIARSFNRNRAVQRVTTAAERARSLAVNTPNAPPLTAEAAPESNNLAQPNDLPSREPVTTEKPLRVEIQTKDPNIRIIWFSQQRPKQGSLNQASKGI